MKLSLVIPCYNEEKNIEPFMECCIETFGNNKNIEYIFINDGSKDNTFSEIKKNNRKIICKHKLTLCVTLCYMCYNSTIKLNLY